MRTNRVAQRHYRSNYVCGLDACERGRELCRAKDWTAAHSAYTEAENCFRKSTHPYAPTRLEQTVRCLGLIAGMMIARDALAISPRTP